MSYFRRVKVPKPNGKVHVYIRLVESHRADGQRRQRNLLCLGPEDRLPELLKKLAGFIGRAKYLLAGLTEGELRAVGANPTELTAEAAAGSGGAVAAGPANGEPGQGVDADGDRNGDALEHQAGDQLEQLADSQAAVG